MIRNKFKGALVALGMGWSVLLLITSCGSGGSDDLEAGLPPPPPQPPSLAAPGPAPGTGNPSPSPSGGATFCTQVYVYGITLHVADHGTQRPIGNATAVIQDVQDKDYQETLVPVNVPASSGIYQGAGERAGTYRLTVSAPGYALQTFDKIVVRPGTCHVEPVSLEVLLFPY